MQWPEAWPSISMDCNHVWDVHQAAGLSVEGIRRWSLINFGQFKNYSSLRSYSLKWNLTIHSDFLLVFLNRDRIIFFSPKRKIIILDFVHTFQAHFSPFLSIEYVSILLEGAKEDINKYLNNFMKLKLIKKQILRQKAPIHSIICETLLTCFLLMLVLYIAILISSSHVPDTTDWKSRDENQPKHLAFYGIWSILF